MLLLCACVFWGRVGRLEALIGTCLRIVRLYIIYALVWLCTHVVLQAKASNLSHSSSSTQWDPHSVFPAGLSRPAAHSCKKQHSAERDICSVRECPNYSWSFNHSGFGLRGICGVSHKCESATLVNGSFIMIVLLYSAPPNYHKTIIPVSNHNSSQKYICAWKGEKPNKRIRALAFSLPLFCVWCN